MSSSSSSKIGTIILRTTISIVWLLVVVNQVHGQGGGCSNICPPINFGTLVPSLCEGDYAGNYANLEKVYPICHPTNSDTIPTQIQLKDFLGPGRVTVISNFYIGCNAGRRESSVFAHVAQKYHERYNNNSNNPNNPNNNHNSSEGEHRINDNRINFITSLKGGTTCQQWANLYQRDALSLFPNSSIVPKEMPWTILDQEYELRDDFFTTPFGHPSYVILDGNLTIRNKFIGPCCGYSSYFDCTADIATRLDTILSESIDWIISDPTNGNYYHTTTTTTNNNNNNNDNNNNNNGTDENEVYVWETDGTGAEEVTDNNNNDTTTTNTACVIGTFSEWSPCSINPCSRSSSRSSSETSSELGFQFRWRTISGEPECPPPIEILPCDEVCNDDSSMSNNINDDDDDDDDHDDDNDTCLPDLGETWRIETVSSGLDGPRDVAFHPSPGYHLGHYSEGRTFHPEEGEEAWVVNGNNHSVSIIASLGTSHQTTISRRDRGYYHYMINATALSFNMVRNSSRSSDRDSLNYWAVCNDNHNSYLETKTPNNFMGPTLYNSNPQHGNLVNRRGEICNKDEPCFFLHADMLHESPGCIGIVHDPETITAYGNVYWAFDATGNQNNGQLVRFDFQQPHGPGSMDHSVAAVRRYVEVQLQRGPPGVHAGMVIHPIRRELYIAVPGGNKILVVDIDTGEYARTAREEYPIYSNRLPSFEYSIWECVHHKVFASGIDMPSGLALSPNGDILFVAERGTGNIVALEIGSGALLLTVPTGYESLGGMSFSLQSKQLYFVDETTNTLNVIRPLTSCSRKDDDNDDDDPWESSISRNFSVFVETARIAIDTAAGRQGTFSLNRNYSCQVNPIVPDAVFFDQVHVGTGYDSDNPNVQSTVAGMDDDAALLANRTDCEPDSDLNFDALLLGGYYCHPCLPYGGADCDRGGICTNIQWNGYTCDNEFIVMATSKIIINTTTTNTTTNNNNNNINQSNNNNESRDDPTFLQEVQLVTTSNATVIDTIVESLRLKEGVTYRFTVRGEEGITVCVYDSHSTNINPISFPGNPLGCATNGPLLLEAGPDLPEQLYLRIQHGEIIANLLVEGGFQQDKNNDDDDDDDDDDEQEEQEEQEQEQEQEDEDEEHSTSSTNETNDLGNIREENSTTSSSSSSSSSNSNSSSTTDNTWNTQWIALLLQLIVWVSLLSYY